MCKANTYLLTLLKLASIILLLERLVHGAYSFYPFSLPRRAKISQKVLERLNYRKDSDVSPTAPPADMLSSNLLNHTVNHQQPQSKDENQSLRLLRTELGVKWLQGNLNYCDRITPLPFVILERVLDTAEDAFLHLRRLPYDWGWRQEDPASKRCRKTVVVLGCGWAAHAFLKVVDTEKFRVIVVSPTNHFVFTPMLAGAAVGTVEYRSMTEAVRAANPTIEDFVEGEAVDIDFENKKVHVRLTSLLNNQPNNLPGDHVSSGTVTRTLSESVDLTYDELVVAVGVRSANLRIPGANTHCFTLKTCEDARRLRVAIGESFEYASRSDVSVVNGNDSLDQQARERARRVTFVIVGGGPTGVELAGELSDFITDITRPRVGAYSKLKEFAKVILVHSGPELLPYFEKSLRDEALQALQRRGVEVRLETKTIEVGKDFVKLQKGDDKENEELVPMGITAWCAGTSPQSFTNTLREKLTEDARAPNGRIYVDPWMRATTNDPQIFGSVFVLGDAACFRDRRSKEARSDSTVSSSFVEQYLPQTAQVAGQQGAYVARLLNRGYNLSNIRPALVEPEYFNMSTSNNFEREWLKLRSLDVADPFIFVNLGLLAYVGGGEALSQVQLGDIPLLTYAGSAAFMLWRSVYLVKQVATRNRVLVTFDWIKSYMFGRDVTRL